MTEAECDLLKHCSRGHKFTMVCASITKWALRGEMPIEMRLECLQHLEKMADQFLTDEVIAIIEPLSKDSFEIVQEARKLGPGKALDVYADKFDVFAALNPSFIEALKRANRGRGYARDYVQELSDARTL
jgi:hypothetical protein